MKLPIRILASITVAMLTVPLAPAMSPRDDAASVEWFEKKVRPILVGHCYACHSADTKPAGELRVDEEVETFEDMCCVPV